MDFLKQLMPQMGGQPQGLLGQGMAQQAAQQIQSRPYMMYMKEMQSLGMPVLPYEQWMQTMQQPKGLLGQ